MRKSASLLILLLLLSVVLVSFPQIGVVKSQDSSVFIRADGSVEGTDKIQVDGNHYILSGNITVDTPYVYGIYVEKDNIVIDGSGYTLEGNGEGIGIHLYQRSGATIKNFNITNWFCGINKPHSNCTFEGNWITGGDIGINLVGTQNCTFIGNELLDNRCDVYLIDSYSNNFSRNNIGRLVWSIAFVVPPGENYFDGNYWGEYEGVDDNGDGFGDTPFTVYWVDYGDRNLTFYDNNPLIKPIVIPEFPSWTLLAMLVIVIMIAVVYRRRLTKYQGMGEE